MDNFNVSQENLKEIIEEMIKYARTNDIDPSNIENLDTLFKAGVKQKIVSDKKVADYYKSLDTARLKLILELE